MPRRSCSRLSAPPTSGRIARGDALGAGAAPVAQGLTPTCASDEQRAFDFWVGEWNVYGPQGELAGSNSIRREYGGCVLHERYETGHGYSGESLNIHDAPRRVWHQTWVDSSGLLLLLEGTLREGKMVLEGDVVGADGTVARHGITWAPNADGSVRQLWETTAANGAWTTAVDGKYIRR